jgi:hypothetical protein
MTIGIVKSEVMVFSCRSPLNTLRMCQCIRPVTASQPLASGLGAFKYLGGLGCRAPCSVNKGAVHNAYVHQAAARGKFAIACMHRKLSYLDIGSNSRQPNAEVVYNSLVMPAILYAGAK